MLLPVALFLKLGGRSVRKQEATDRFVISMGQLPQMPELQGRKWLEEQQFSFHGSQATTVGLMILYVKPETPDSKTETSPHPYPRAIQYIWY